MGYACQNMIHRQRHVQFIILHSDITYVWGHVGEQAVIIFQ